MSHLQLLNMESRIHNPPMFHPLFAFVRNKSSKEKPSEGVSFGLTKVAELVGKNLPHQLGIHNRHSRYWSKPSEAYLACMDSRVLRQDPL